VTELTLVPRPAHDVEIYQPITSPDTLEYAPAVGHHGIFWLQAPSRLQKKWDRYGEIAAAHGYDLRPGERRALVLNVHVGPVRDRAIETVRDAHDEFIRFLAPYGRFTSYLEPDGATPKPFGYRPEVEDSIEQRIMAIGSVDDVVDVIGAYREELGLEHLVVFPEFPGLTREQIDEQLHLVAEEVLPRLGAPLVAKPPVAKPPVAKLADAKPAVDGR
jgi:alkanesulfonate monooxygenase SsuD/methylene tetrahydromethanopterin reductase-like flavin-dependent oxidoreductase (luciferase family)